MSGFDPNKINTKIYLDGEPVNNRFIGLSVSTEVNRIPRARIELNYREVSRNEGSEDEVILDPATGFDPRPKRVKHDFLPGKEVQIELGRGKDRIQIFKGYIIKQVIEARNNGQLILCVDCKHKANRMTLHKRTRFFHHDANKKQSAKEQIDAVGEKEVWQYLIEQSADYGLSLDTSALKNELPQHENMTQYQCSDWDFLIMRAEALGYVCLPKADQIQLISPSVAPVATETVTLGNELMEYEAEYDETQSAERNVFVSWNIQNQKNSEENLKNNAIENTASKVQTPNYNIHGGDLTDEELQANLAGLVKRQQLGLVRGTAKVKGSVKFSVGNTLSIRGFESIWDRETFVSGIKHELRNGVWYTYIQCGLSCESHAEKYGLSTGTQQHLIPSANGLLYGKVKQYKNSESGHELIEVELTAYNDLDEKGESKKTIYARLATLAAGKNGGAVFRPYPDDEVVIGFINNDPRFPVILGAVYNGNNQPPYEWEDHETQHEVGFSINDWKISIHEKDEKMTIASPGGQQFLLDDNEESIHIMYDDSNGIKITSEGIELEAQKITLKGSNGIELEGMKIEAKADTSVKIEGGTQLELEGKVTASLKGQITEIN